MLKYNKKYKLVIDSKPFSLNNYEESIQELMAFNYIMKSEDNNFNFSEIIKTGGKSYYNISEDTYNKINTLKTLKGIYTYVYDEKDSKNAWEIGSIIGNISDDNIIKGTLQEELNNELRDNKIPKMDFMLDERAIYSNASLASIENNKGIKLTINSDIQAEIRKIFEKEEYAKFNNIGVTLIESKTGKIKAMVQKDESQPNINLGMEGLGYEPGSVFKVVTLASAIEEGKVNVNQKYFCNGSLCKGREHGYLNAQEALTKSCNTIFAQLGNTIGKSKLLRYSGEVGLFNRVLNMQQNGATEAIGAQPTILEDGMNNISIGQSFNVTPLQMVGAINSVVNNGVYVKPYIIDELVDINDNVLKKYETESKREFSEVTSKLVKNAMREVVRTGTGIKANVYGVDIGGKTGTAEYRAGSDHGWFIGFFSVNNIEYTMCVMIPSQEEVAGGDSAAPIFRDIVKMLNEKK